MNHKILVRKLTTVVFSVLVFLFSMNFALAINYFPLEELLNDTASSSYEIKTIDANHDQFPDFLQCHSLEERAPIWLSSVLYGQTVVKIIEDNSRGFINIGEPMGQCEVSHLNKDNFDDVIMALPMSNNILIVLGKSTLYEYDQTKIALNSDPMNPVAKNPSQILVTDLNGDGNNDLIIGNLDSNNLSILIGDGTGKFSVLPATVAVGGKPLSLAAGDFNKDDNQDIAVIREGMNDVLLLFGNKMGGFPSQNTLSVSSPQLVTAADLGKGLKGLLVLKTVDMVHSQLSFFDSKTAGAIPTERTELQINTDLITSFKLISLGVSTLRDEYVDVVLASPSTNKIYIFLNRENKKFELAEGSPITKVREFVTGGEFAFVDLKKPDQLLINDFNGDGAVDILFQDRRTPDRNSIVVLFGNSPPEIGLPNFDGNGKFSIGYFDINGEPPTMIKVKVTGLNGTSEYDLDLDPSKGFEYSKVVPLPPGKYKYQFFANDGTYDAIKASDAPDLGISTEASFELDHAVPAPSSGGSGGCALIQSNSNNFKIGSIFFLMSIGVLFLRRERVKN